MYMHVHTGLNQNDWEIIIDFGENEKKWSPFQSGESGQEHTSFCEVDV